MIRLYLLFPLIILISLLSHAQEVNPDINIISHDIRVTFDLQKHSMEAKDLIKIHIGKDRELGLLINESLDAFSVKVDGKEIPFEVLKNFDISQFERKPSNNTEEKPWQDKAFLKIDIPESLKGQEEIITEVSYRATFDVPHEETEFSRELISDVPSAVISKRGVFLDPSIYWYPHIPDNLSKFRVTTITPKGYDTVAAGEKIEREEKGGKVLTIWDFPHPSPGVHLIAGRYKIREDNYRDIKIYTYFFPEDDELGSGYIKAVKRYLKLYEELFGKYPFKKFAVVASFFPAGYGMPSFTVLGQAVIRLPFIVDTSLGHEIAHNWWGNYVYVDYTKGNWSEGLTTYSADYLYEELKGEEKAVGYRRQILRDYANYVSESNDFPLSKFRERTTPASRSIGYGKAAMVFHALRRMIGDKNFYEALGLVIERKSFQRASWEDLKKAFEEISREDLDWYFSQWIERDGAPFIDIGNVNLEKDKDSYRIDLELIQKGTPYVLDLPIVIKTPQGEVTSRHRIKKERNLIEIKVESKPDALTVDPFYHVFRRLQREEIPPLLSQILGDENKIIVYPSRASKDMKEAYLEAAEVIFGEESSRIKSDREVEEHDIKNNSLVILGGVKENSQLSNLISTLPEEVRIGEDSFSIRGKTYNQKGDLLLVVTNNTYNKSKALAILFGLSPEAVLSASSKIIHYGKYSYLVFRDGVNQGKGVENTEGKGLFHRFK